ncbi:MAG: tol-pal system protein YbgF [Gammaproteobacteria bacterium]|nr:tol-pal system protein YbgF [Gammaproteobacteria bacterium]
MNTTQNSVISRVLTAATILILSMIAPVFAQSQALTPEQLTQQVRTLSERSENAASVLRSMQQEVTKMSRLIDNRAMLELMQSVEQLSSEISLLRGEMEQQSNDISQIKKRQRELYLDIDRRLRDLESRAVSKAPSTAPVEVPGLNEAQEEDTPVVSNTATTTAGGATESTGLISDATSSPGSSQGSQSTAGSSNASVSKEQAAYQAAFDTLKEGRYNKAKAEFSRFLKQYPDSSFAGNAQYWLGEANYVTRNFDQGIIEFELVLSRYPSSSKVPDAMLKLGYTYYEKKQYNKAKIMLTELRKRYPNATAARLAGKRLDRIQQEGF